MTLRRTPQADPLRNTENLRAGPAPTWRRHSRPFCSRGLAHQGAASSTKWWPWATSECFGCRAGGCRDLWHVSAVASHMTRPLLERVRSGIIFGTLAIGTDMTPSNRPSSASRHTRALPLLASFHSCAAASSRWSRKLGCGVHLTRTCVSHVEFAAIPSTALALAFSTGCRLPSPRRTSHAIVEVVSLLLDPTPSQRPTSLLPSLCFLQDFLPVLGRLRQTPLWSSPCPWRTPSIFCKPPELSVLAGAPARILGIVRGDLL